MPSATDLSLCRGFSFKNTLISLTVKGRACPGAHVMMVKAVPSSLFSPSTFALVPGVTGVARLTGQGP